MYAGARPDLLDLIRCPEDAGILTMESSVEHPVREGRVVCRSCARAFEIRDGILVLLAIETVNTESERERAQRDRDAGGVDLQWENEATSRSEIASTLKSLEPIAGSTLLELGCGCGRFTHRFPPASVVVAVDFSFQSLCRLAARLAPEARVLLVCGDITRFNVKPNAFDRVFSTLTSNLPTRDLRDAMYQLAARALSPSGRFVSSAHYFGLRERLHGVRKVGHYERSAIFRQYFDVRELRREARVYFRDVKFRRIQVLIPFAGRLGLSSPRLARLAEWVPLLNLFAELVLVTAAGGRTSPRQQT